MLTQDELADLSLARQLLALAEMARTIGVAAATVCRWESGNRTPRGAAGARYGALLRRLSAGVAVDREAS